MKFLDAVTKIKTLFDVFKKPSEGGNRKARRIALILAIVAAGILLLIGIAVLVRKIRQRRLEKEAEEEAMLYYNTEPDADEYTDDGSEEA